MQDEQLYTGSSAHCLASQLLRGLKAEDVFGHELSELTKQRFSGSKDSQLMSALDQALARRAKFLNNNLGKQSMICARFIGALADPLVQVRLELPEAVLRGLSESACRAFIERMASACVAAFRVTKP